MHLLYADDSGVVSNPNTKYSVLAGFATFESQTYWIQKTIDSIMEKYKIHKESLAIYNDLENIKALNCTPVP